MKKTILSFFVLTIFILTAGATSSAEILQLGTLNENTSSYFPQLSCSEFLNNPSQIDLWMKVYKSGQDKKPILEFADTSLNNIFKLDFNSKKKQIEIEFIISNKTQWKIATPTNKIHKKKKWYHITITHNKIQPLIYINGIQSPLLWLNTNKVSSWINNIPTKELRCSLGYSSQDLNKTFPGTLTYPIFSKEISPSKKSRPPKSAKQLEIPSIKCSSWGKCINSYKVQKCTLSTSKKTIKFIREAPCQTQTKTNKTSLKPGPSEITNKTSPKIPTQKKETLLPNKTHPPKKNLSKNKTSPSKNKTSPPKNNTLKKPAINKTLPSKTPEKPAVKNKTKRTKPKCKNICKKECHKECKDKCREKEVCKKECKEVDGKKECEKVCTPKKICKPVCKNVCTKNCTKICKDIPDQLFDITFELSSETIKKSSDLETWITLQNFGKSSVPARMLFKIYDSQNKLVYREIQETTVYTDRLFIKKFDDLILKPGTYTIKMEVEYAGITENFEKHFKIQETLWQKIKQFLKKLI